MSGLTVGVLIPAHDEAETIVRCIQAVRASDYPVDEIVVVADACSDDTAELARLAGADRVVETSFKDKASAQNHVLWEMDQDVIVGFDGDTWPSRDCIRLMVEDLEQNGWDATCSTILPAQGHEVPYSDPEHTGQAVFFTSSRRFAYALGRRWWRLCQAKVGRIQVLTGACYAFRKEAIRAIGGFPNGLITSDMDATWQMHEKGYKLGYTGDALALTMDPESFTVYRSQMRRWASGYFQNMAKHRRQMANWRSALVVGTALLDMALLLFYEVFVTYSVVTWSNTTFLKALVFWTGIHWVVTTGLVASVVGVKQALKGVVPYTLVNYYNKWLYTCAFFREWVLGKHFASWTGRQGRKTVITPMTRGRKAGLLGTSLVLAGLGLGAWAAEWTRSAEGLWAFSAYLVGAVTYWHFRDQPQGRHKAVVLAKEPEKEPVSA